MTLKEYLESYDRPLNEENLDEGIKDILKKKLSEHKEGIKKFAIALGGFIGVVSSLFFAGYQLKKAGDEMRMTFPLESNMENLEIAQHSLQNLLTRETLSLEMMEKGSKQIQAAKRLILETKTALRKYNHNISKEDKEKIKEQLKQLEVAAKITEQVKSEIYDEAENNAEARSFHNLVTGKSKAAYYSTESGKKWLTNGLYNQKRQYHNKKIK